jgi:hypothetical protein
VEQRKLNLAQSTDRDAIIFCMFLDRLDIAHADCF